MSWRSELEDKYTVKCRWCGHESIDPAKQPAQKYVKGKCPHCGKEGKKR